MHPKIQSCTPQDDLFRLRLENLIDRCHELVKLSQVIDWQRFDEQWGTLFVAGQGAPALRTRLIAGLHYLKHAYGLSDEEVVARWRENPYWQYFCGEEYFQHELPCHPTSLTKWRQRLGAAGCEQLLKETIAGAQRSKLVKATSLDRVIVDTTVQEKNVTFPTDAKLLDRARKQLVKLSRRHDLVLRQNYNRIAKHLLRQIGRYGHAKQFKRQRRALTQLKTRVGRVYRDVQRQLAEQPLEVSVALAELLGKTERLLTQTRHSHNKLYSVHAPEVECLSKGKAHKRYEFGVKASFAVTHKEGLVVGALSCPGNPYDGHTLEPQLHQVQRLTDHLPKQGFVDKGYRGVEIEGIEIYRSGQKRGVHTRRLKQAIKRREAIEPEIGHMKSDGLLGRCYLKGSAGDAMNIILCGAGHNIRKLLRWLRFFCRLFIGFVTGPVHAVCNITSSKPTFSGSTN